MTGGGSAGCDVAASAAGVAGEQPRQRGDVIVEQVRRRLGVELGRVEQKQLGLLRRH